MTEPSNAGLFVQRGMGLRIPVGGLVISVDPSGAPKAELTKIEFSLDMCTAWLRVALGQLDLAEQSSRAAIAAAASGDDANLGQSMEAECAAGMIAMAAAAFAIDAFYAALKDRSPRVQAIPVSKRRRSSRHKIVLEALRREFKIAPTSLRNLQNIVKEVFKFRDLAVHPTGRFTSPVLKPEVGKLTEWRFVTFGAANARLSVRATLAALVQLVEIPKSSSADTKLYLEGLKPALDELAVAWRSARGLLTDTV